MNRGHLFLRKSVRECTYFLFIAATSALSFPRPSYAVPSATAVGCGDVGGYVSKNGLIAKAVVKTTLWLLSDNNVWVPFEPVGTATGQASASAVVSSRPQVDASSTGIIFQELPQGGSIYAGVTAGPVSQFTSFPPRSASAKGEIYALPVQHPQSQGAEISSIFTDNTCKASVVLGGIAVGAAASGTDPFIYPASDRDRTARILVDLVSRAC